MTQKRCAVNRLIFVRTTLICNPEANRLNPQIHSATSLKLGLRAQFGIQESGVHFLLQLLNPSSLHSFARKAKSIRCLKESTRATRTTTRSPTAKLILLRRPVIR